MAHFAQLDENNIVTQVIVVNNDVLLDENGIEQEQVGIDFCKSLFGVETNWKQTSYNSTFRKNFAGIEYEYNSSLDAFISPKPFASWILDEETCTWKAPKEKPETSENQFAKWNEELLDWEIIDLPSADQQ